MSKLASGMAQKRMPQHGSLPAFDSQSAARVAFPQSSEDFDSDPRVSYDKLNEKYILEDDDGSEWDWDDSVKRWVPALDDTLKEQQSQAYHVSGVDEHEPAEPPNKKRKNDDNQNGSSKKQRPPGKTPVEKKNTAVYVTSIPFNATKDEVNQLFSRFGVIAEEIESGNPRIKMYTDEKGDFKGEALVVYFKPQSVKLAIDMADDSDFRLGEKGPMGAMRVKEADMSFKKHKNEEPEAQGKEKKEKPKGFGDKRKVIERTEKLNSKLADWSDDDDDPSTLTQTSSRFDKVVVLRYMFTLKELTDDPAAILDIKEDIRDECGKLGTVTNVQLYDREEAGVATVRFQDPQAARACVRLMEGRHFDGRTVRAAIADGREKFKKTKKAANDDGEDERLDEFGKWLEEDGVEQAVKA